MKKLLFICLFFTLALPLSVLADSSLYLDPTEGTYPIGTSFSVAVKVNTGGSAVNVAQGTIIFNNNILAVTSLDTFSGDFTSCVGYDTNFSNATGIIRFVCGYISPGSPPNTGYTGTAGTVIKINFRGISLGEGRADFDTNNSHLPAKVYLNTDNSNNLILPPGGQSAANGGVYTIVAPTLTASCSASPGSATVNQAIVYRASASGGTGSYSYSWSGVCDGTNSTCSKSFDTTGIKTATVSVTSGAETVTRSCEAGIGLPGLNVSCTASKDVADIGEEVTFNASVSGGGGAYQYSWSGACSGSSSACSSSFDASGLKTATVTVISGDKASSANCSFYANTVCPPVIPPEPRDPIITTEIIENVIERIVETTNEIKEIANNPIVSGTTKVATAIGVAAAVASSPFSWAGILRALGVILSAFGLKRKFIPWGIVYDSITKQPLDPAYVTLRDLNGKDISSAITDIDGRYGFLAEPGTYTITANKTNYIFPSKKLAGKNSDELYDNLYFGENAEIKRGEVITRNIPMDALNFDWNEYAKRNKKLLKFYSRWDMILREFSDFAYFLGFFVAIFAFWAAPYPYNTIILGLYIVILLLRVLGMKPRSYGSVREKTTGMPLPFAILKVSDPESNREVSKRVTDKYGRFFCLVPKGKYIVKIEKKNDDGSYSLIYTSQVVDVSKKGIIKNKFKI